MARRNFVRQVGGSLSSKIRRMQAEIKELGNSRVVAGWLDPYNASLAYIHEDGAELKGGQPYFFDKNGNIQFMKKEGPMNSKGKRKGSMGVTKASKIPPRPVIKNTAMKHKQEWQEKARPLAKGVISGKTGTYEALEKMGVIIASDIQGEIVGGKFKANSPLTIQRKGKNMPLRNKGNFLNAVDFEVQKKQLKQK